MWYKLIDGELVSTSTTKEIEENGIKIIVKKDKSELDGYKPLYIEEQPYANVYQDIEVEYTEWTDRIIQKYNIVDKTEDEIIQVNESFWSEKYLQIMSLMPEELYVPIKNYLDGKEHDLIKDDLAVMLMGAAAGQLTHLELYRKPVMKNQITKEYMEQFKITITDFDKMTLVLGYLAQISYANRDVPVVI